MNILHINALLLVQRVILLVKAPMWSTGLDLSLYSSKDRGENLHGGLASRMDRTKGVVFILSKVYLALFFGRKYEIILTNVMMKMVMTFMG